MPFRPPSGGGGGGSIDKIQSSVPTIAVSSPTGPTTTVDLESGIVTPGTYGSSLHVPFLTVDTYGRVTAASNGNLHQWNFAQTSETSNFSATNGNFYLCSGTLTASLQAASAAGAGNWIVIKNTGTGVVTITPNGTDDIDGTNASVLMATQNETIWLTSDGVSNWWLT